MFVPTHSDSGSKRDGIDAPTMSARTGNQASSQISAE